MNNRVSRRDFLKGTSKAALVSGLGACGLLLKGCRTKQDFDLVIKNGRIYDGLGNEAFTSDIGIIGNVIDTIGPISHRKGKSVIDAEGMAVCPGFIDAHDHTDVSLFVSPKAESAAHQGITTLVSGNCGDSPFPIAAEVYEETKERLAEIYGLELNWTDLDGFWSRLERNGTALNYATLVGQGTIRGAVVGFNDRPCTAEELEQMKNLVRENIRQGAIGLSSGLEYAPGSYAQADEVTELCRAAAENGGVYSTHMRDEGDYLIEALDETISVARQTGIRIQISHFKIAYPRNWEKIDEALAKIEEAARSGIALYCDRYPYIAGSTGLSLYFPLWARQGTTAEFLGRLMDPAQENGLRAYLRDQEKKLGSWDKVVIASVVTDKNKMFEGKSVLQGAQESGKGEFEFMRDLLIDEKNNVGMVTFMMSEDNLMRILSHPLVGVGCDGSARAPYGVLGTGKPHPRNYGTFPRVLGKYIREEQILPMPEMIKKMTSVPARNFGFSRRGAIRQNHFADIDVFDKENVIDKATWTDPHQYPEGIHYVFVNGEAVIDRGDQTDRLPGVILKKTKS